MSRLSAFYKVLFGLTNNPTWDFELSLVIQSHLFWILGTLILCMPVYHYAKDWMAKRFTPSAVQRMQYATIALNLVLLLISVSLLVGKSYNPFLYFRF
jgi:alginate O-acetyltransferase complex protein AlgI